MKNFFSNNKQFQEQSLEEVCYSVLKASKYAEYPFAKESIGDNMGLVKEVIMGYWKPRYLLNHHTKCAYEFLNSGEYFVSVTLDDIDMDSLKELPAGCMNRVTNLSAHFPTIIRSFENGVAQVSWQVTPDGRYYMDEDGYGMTDDEEITLYGFIDKIGKVIVKFKAIKNWNELEEMKRKAEKINSNQNANK